jgi:hypothetical protein
MGTNPNRKKKTARSTIISKASFEVHVVEIVRINSKTAVRGVLVLPMDSGTGGGGGKAGGHFMIALNPGGFEESGTKGGQKLIFDLHPIDIDPTGSKGGGHLNSDPQS